MPVIMPDDFPPAQSLAQIMETNIPFPTRLETDGSAASCLQDEPKALHTATLITSIGLDALEVFGGFVFEEKDIDVVLRKFEDYYVGATNEIYKRSKFNSRVQEEGELVDTFITALRHLTETCNYGTLSDQVSLY